MVYSYAVVEEIPEGLYQPAEEKIFLNGTKKKRSLNLSNHLLIVVAIMPLDNMAKLVGYAMMSANKNTINNGHLVKAMCEFCGRKFGSIDEARRCETKHINDAIRKNLNEAIKINF